MDTCSRRLYTSGSAVAGRWTMYAEMVTGMTSGPEPAGIGGYKYIHDCAGVTAGRKEKTMAHLYFMAGHGAGDPGACANGYQEAERVRALASRVSAFGGGNVTILDTSRNWYADNGISNLSLPADACLLEAHMDSAAASARGGHVIIKSGYSPDAYDNALAAMLQRRLPGRSQMIVGRSDLANPRRAAARGINYRLVEFGFITNTTDLNIFNTQIDDIAREVIQCFEITPSSAPAPSSPTASGGTTVLAVDGSCGPATIRRWQEVMGTTVDGIISGQLVPDCVTYWRPNLVDSCVTYGGTGSELIRAVQRKLASEGRYSGSIDGLLGPGTIRGIQAHYGLTQDASFGPATVRALPTRLNTGWF